MSLLSEHLAAMAAELIDCELYWRLGRISDCASRSALDNAIVREAQARGFLQDRTARSP